MSEERLLDRYPEAIAWTDEVTVVGHGMHLEGDLSSAGVVVVAGLVDGSVESERLVRILPGGVVRGPIRASSAVIEGAVDGDIEVEDQIELAPSGRVRGDVSGPRVAVAEGAYLKGRLRATAGRIHQYREKRAG
jgi:cytoskeletal protein CcmA (bactofilin family)